ncbi:hypothetical protein QA601_09015 [Chitinispirillales bacterium ANBcel5]|uniref:hypothetical protein n=1 Tax=Cellulosispirillum alkaliphilum TaxID=3039283 RepID=UPI002A4F84C1|nr:hypothetical protein [Chitinispirillales bacterium ANBcel5]
MRFTISCLTLCVLVLILPVSSQPDLSISGYLDTDVWTDFSGNYFTNSELDLGAEFIFSDNVSANLYVTVNSDAYAPSGGRIPAGQGDPSERWLQVNIDGFDVTYASPYGTFSVGDLVYQFGTFDYYFYKRRSMITPESFTRGLSYSLDLGSVTQELILGVADVDYNTVDAIGVSSIGINENHSLSLAYGIRGSALEDFSGFNLFGGAEYNGSFGMLDIKADIGFTNYGAEDRYNVLTLLVEPYMEMANFYTAFAFYRLFDFDEINSPESPLFGIEDEMFFYFEPGYAFNDVVAFGLPIEYHWFVLDDDDDNEVWLVPTFYVFPADGVEWWIWGQAAFPTNSEDPGYALGMEIIVSF